MIDNPLIKQSLEQRNEAIPILSFSAPALLLFSLKIFPFEVFNILFEGLKQVHLSLIE
jgi:hypothetical protein